MAGPIATLMSAVTYCKKLHWFAITVVLATLGLIGLGGLVTSHQAGMAVPDWPTTYGYNMFFFPISQWVGGIFYEHTHRLYAAFIGLLTSILAAWLWWRGTSGKSRWAGLLVMLVLMMALGHRGSGHTTGGASVIPFHFKILAVVMPWLLLAGIVQSVRHRGALHWLGLTAFFAVIFQGILGGLRVALYKDEVGIFHATLAQLFLLLLSAIALMTSRWWGEVRVRHAVPSLKLVQGTGMLSLLMIAQLVLGASMRHQHAGLAVPDFPLAYGKVWPETDAAALDRYNHSPARMDTRDFDLITANHIYLHMAHRIGAGVIWLAVVGLAVSYARKLGAKAVFAKAAIIWAGLISAQAVLGAYTIWTNKAADIATAHVMMGAISLIFGAVLTLCGFRCLQISSNLPVTAAKSGSAQQAQAIVQPVLADR